MSSRTFGTAGIWRAGRVIIGSIWLAGAAWNALVTTRMSRPFEWLDASPWRSGCDCLPDIERQGGWIMWWHDLLWGFWNGLTAWIVLIAHVFGQWDGQAVYDSLRAGNWYDFGFLVGAGSPLLGTLGGKHRSSAPRSARRRGDFA